MIEALLLFGSIALLVFVLKRLDDAGKKGRGVEAALGVLAFKDDAQPLPPGPGKGGGKSEFKLKVKVKVESAPAQGPDTKPRKAKGQGDA